MKIKNLYLFIIYFFLIVLYNTTLAQILKVNVSLLHISGIMPGTFVIQLENRININSSLEVAGGYYYLEPNFSGDGDYSGFKFDLAYKKYINNNEVYDGFYFSPSIRYLQTGLPEKDEPIIRLKTGSRKGVGFGLSIGKQKVIKDHLSFEATFGIVYYRNFTKMEFEDSTIYQSWNSRFEPNIGISFGWIIKNNHLQQESIEY